MNKNLTNKELKDIEQACGRIMVSGHGEVVIKIKNGVIYRILETKDRIVV